MATMTIQGPSKTGAALTYTAAADGDLLLNDGKTWLHVKNGGGAPITVTITAVGACSQGVLHDEVITIANGADKAFGPFRPDIYNDADTGKLTIHYSGVTSVTVAAFHTS